MVFWRRNPKKFVPPDGEPLFAAIRNDDPQIESAHAMAARTLPHFLACVLRSGSHMCCAKLRFRDPDLSGRLGEDRFFFLWLNSVVYHSEENVFSGSFFELPPELMKWHQVGQRLGFEAEDIFDWMVNDNGHLHGGFTLRVARARLPESELAEFDRYSGVMAWEPLPTDA